MDFDTKKMVSIMVMVFTIWFMFV